MVIIHLKNHTFVRFEVTDNDDANISYVDVSDEILLVNFCPIALFSEVKFTTNFSKFLQQVEKLQLAFFPWL